MTTNLIACHAIDLQCCQDNLNYLHNTVLTTHHLSTIYFEQEHATTIWDYNLRPSIDEKHLYWSYS